MRRLLLILAVLIGWAAGQSAGAVQGRDDAAAIFERANAAFRHGLELSGSKPDEARAEFGRAAAGYETLSAQARNERLLVNLGNAYLLAGDPGRAVLNYRRALRLAPADAGATAGLAAARDRVGVVVPGRGTAMRTWASAWRAVIPAPAVWAVAGLAWAAGWGLLTLRPPRVRLGAAVAACWAVAAVGGGLHLAERWVERTSHDAVLVRDGVVGLNGPAAGVYQPTFDKPLAAGVEVRVLERRPGWARVVLADGRESWLPVETIEEL